MSTFIGLLRAINLGSHNKVSMPDLKAWLVELGMKNPQSVVQSGNLVFGSAPARRRHSRRRSSGRRRSS